jgi:hypothetical protein
MEKRFYVTADMNERGRVAGYYVRYDNGKVYSYFAVDRKCGGAVALHLANMLRDDMNAGVEPGVVLP